MVEEYRAPTTVNKIFMWMNRLGLGRSETLTTTGKRSGKPREVPVSPIEVEGQEYLVAPYGEVSWVHNARANPSVTLRSGGTVRQCRLVDVSHETPHVVKAYWDREKFSQKYMDVPGDADVSDFASVAGRFPIFRVEEEA